MQFIVFKPITSSKRHYLNIYNKLNKKSILKFLIIKNTNSAGRNNTGKITVRHKGSLKKRLYRILNFKNQTNLIGIVFSLEYDPFRTSNIASVYNIKDKSFLYILAPKNLKIGNIVKVSSNNEKKIGNFITLNQVPIGCPIYNISFKIYCISKLSRSAGTYSLLINRNQNKCEILLSSGTKIFLPINAFCNIGIVSNQYLFLKQLGKAGISRWLNRRPTVRGVSMNPVDHPNGGGKGKKSSKKRSPWGKLK